MANPQPDITTEADIQLLVDGFYAKVVEDALLDPVFNDFAHVNRPSQPARDVRFLEQPAAGHHALARPALSQAPAAAHCRRPLSALAGLV